MINYQRVWANLDTDDRIAFRDRTIKAVQEIYPNYIVRPLEPGDPDHFFVGNKQDNVRIKAPLRDVFARFSTTAGKTNDDLKEAIFAEYAQVLNLAEDSSVIQEQEIDFTWIDVKDTVRLQHYRLDEVPDGKLSYPFGDEVVSAFVIDRGPKHMLHWVTQEMIDSWGKTQEELRQQAMANLGNVSNGLELAGIETPRNELWSNEGFAYASTCLLMPSLLDLIGRTLEFPFRFGIPSQHRFYAWIDIDDEKYQIEMKAKMEREVERLPNALTSVIFQVDSPTEIKVVKPQPEIPPVPMISNN